MYDAEQKNRGTYNVQIVELVVLSIHRITQCTGSMTITSGVGRIFWQGYIVCSPVIRNLYGGKQEGKHRRHPDREAERVEGKGMGRGVLSPAN